MSGLQSAWFRWNIIGDLQYHVIMGDNWYGVTVETDAGGTERISLLNMDLSERFSTTGVDGEEFDYRIHMDYTSQIANVDLTFANNVTTLLYLFLTSPMPIGRCMRTLLMVVVGMQR